MPDFVECLRDITEYKSDILFLTKVWDDDVVDFYKLTDCTVPRLKTLLVFRKDVMFLYVIKNIFKKNFFHNFTEYACKWDWSVIRRI